MNFANLTKPGVIPAVPERFAVIGFRTDLTFGREWSVRCLCEIKDDRALYIVEGGVTGYESFLIEEPTLTNIANGWTACFGMKGRWDKLFIDDENMTALVAWIRSQYNGKIE